MDAPIQKRLRGTGLGLSLSKQAGDAARRRRRASRARSAGLDVLGRRSRCSCRHDRDRRRHGRASGGERMPTMADAASATILVVDDNPPTRYSTSPRPARRRASRCSRPATGHEALRAGRTRPATWSCSTSTCPTSTASRSAAGCGPRRATARTPVIHLSATFVNDDDKVHGLDAGADGYLTHPVEPPVLIATVNAFLRARRAEDALRESEAKFKAVFEQALNGIALLSDDMIFLDVNPAMCATLGRDRADDRRQAHLGLQRRRLGAPASTRSPRRSPRPARGAARCRCCTRDGRARRARVERLDPLRPGHPPRHHHRRHRARARSRPSGSGCWPASARRGPRPSAPTG